MTDTIALTGLVATTPRHLVTTDRLPITSFRLASTQRRYDRGSAKWIDGETNWYTITCFRQLAINVVGSIEKGQRIVVTGRLRVRAWESGDRTGTTVEIDADAVGHDLAWGTAVFSRSIVATTANDTDQPSDSPAVLENSPQGSDDGGDGSEGSPESTDLAGELAVALPF